MCNCANFQRRGRGAFLKRWSMSRNHCCANRFQYSKSLNCLLVVPEMVRNFMEIDFRGHPQVEEVDSHLYFFIGCYAPIKTCDVTAYIL